MKEDFVIYISPSERDDWLSQSADIGLEPAATYLHNHVFSSLEADCSRMYVIDTVYTLQYTLARYPEDLIRIQTLIDNSQLTVSGNYIGYHTNQHDQESVIRFVTYAKWYLRRHFGYEAKFIKRPRCNKSYTTNRADIQEIWNRSVHK